MKDCNIFFIPFWYSKQTRFKTNVRFASWIIIYLIPVLLSFLFFSSQINLTDLMVSFLGISLVYNLYEIGYIYNDAETIKSEIAPTLRLNTNQLQFYEKHKRVIYLFRFFIALTITIILLLREHSMSFLVVCWLIIPTYVGYNLVRSRLNIPLHFVLVTLRYCSPALLFSGIFNVHVFILMILLFPLINTLERCAENRFELNFFKTFFLTNRKSGRYIYYFILFAIGLVCYYVSNSYIFIIFSIYGFYYMIFRLLSAQVSLNE